MSVMKARNDIVSINIGLLTAAAGKPMSARPTLTGRPDDLWFLDCPQCELFLAAVPLWAKNPDDVPETSVEAKVLEAELEALYQAALEKWEDAGRALHVAQLQDQVTAVQAVLDEHARAHKVLASAKTRREKAEDAAAALTCSASTPAFTSPGSRASCCPGPPRTCRRSGGSRASASSS